MITCVAGGYAATWHIETILFSGAVIFILGALLAARGFVVDGWWLAAWTGASGPLFATAVFLTVNLNGWSPKQAVMNGVPRWVVAYGAAAGILALVCLGQRIRLGRRSAPEPR